SIALISDRFPPAERGKALGTWNSLGPIATMIGPTLGGFLVDTLTWRTIFIPVLLVGLAAVWGLSRLVTAGQQQFARPGFLRTFDWPGVVFLAVATVGFFSFTSSRPITGVAPLRDWRLLALGLVGLMLFLGWERFRTEPFIRLALFRRSTFSRASLTSASRMFLMSAVFFLIPLYLTDIHQVSASGIGVQLMIHGIGLLATMRLGGQMADRWGSRVPVMLGAGGQMGAIVYLAFLPADTALVWVTAGLVAHGLGAGLYLAPLHRAAMSCIPADQTGMAAGLYSMVRFAGSAMGSALAGVLLQAGLDSGAPPIQAYQTVLWALAGMALLGVVIGGGLREHVSG
ncbi:MAG: MFS transporter, partial [Chloroflexi bacterium]